MQNDITVKQEIPAEPLAGRKSRMQTSLCDVELAEMTKDTVETLLRGNINNRRINEANVRKFLDDVKAGHYTFTGEPVIRDQYGVLRDGQHRLLALREAGYPPVKMLIVTLKGEKSRIEEAYNNMNKGVARRFGQLLTHKGMDNALKVAALCKKIPYISTNFTNFAPRTDSYYLDVYQLYRYEIDAIAPYLKTTGFRADMGAAACLVAKVTGCLDEICAVIRKAIDADMLAIGSPEHTLNKIINGNLRAVKKGQGSNAFDFAVTAHCLIAALNKEKYPMVNRDAKKACDWIKQMAVDNSLILTPRGGK